MGFRNGQVPGMSMVSEISVHSQSPSLSPVHFITQLRFPDTWVVPDPGQLRQARALRDLQGKGAGVARGVDIVGLSQRDLQFL